MTFGIPTQFLPVDTEGNVRLEHHRSWLEQRRHLESKMSSMKNDPRSDRGPCHYVTPGPLDVLFGREKARQLHPGNIRYQDIITTNLQLYNVTPTKKEKTRLAQRLVEKIKVSGGRFLRLESGGWVVVDDDAARDKVTTAFRSRRKYARTRNDTMPDDVLESAKHRLAEDIEINADFALGYTVLDNEGDDSMYCKKRPKQSQH